MSSKTKALLAEFEAVLFNDLVGDQKIKERHARMLSARQKLIKAIEELEQQSP